jgi:DNA-binding CsgD family transcriptional regulator
MSVSRRARDEVHDAGVSAPGASFALETTRGRGTLHRQESALPDPARIVAAAARAAVATDAVNVITHWNAEATSLFGISSEEALGRNFQDLSRALDVFGNPLCRDHCAFHSMVRAGAAPENFELDVFSADRSKVRVSVSIVVVLGPDPGDYSLVYLLTPKRRRRRADEAIDRLLGQRDPTGGPQTGAGLRGRRHMPALTRRQKEVLALMVLGRNSVEMAAELGVSVHTVRSHVQAVLKAFDASTRLEAVTRALSGRTL